MPDSTILVPLRQSMVVDLIRFSNGALTPEAIGSMAEEQLLDFFERSFTHSGPNWFGDRALEFAEIYFPHIAQKWTTEDLDAVENYRKDNKPLVWKEVTIAHGSKVRMHYGGEHHFATVENGRIVDESGSYSPSEWASKVAGGTSRSAWRDLWFKEPLASTWVPAQLLRDQALSELPKVVL